MGKLCIGMVIQSAKSEDIHGVLVEHNDSDECETFDIVWSDGSFYDKVIVSHITQNRVLGYKSDEEVLAWRLKYG